MSQKSEDSIERFFRKGVVQQDKTFMERDWQSMEKMLDDQAMTAASVRAGKSKIASRVGVGIVLISFLFLIGVEKEIPENTVQMQAAVGALGPRIEVKNENPTADLHSFEKDKTNDVGAKESESGNAISANKIIRSAEQQAQPKTNVSKLKFSNTPSKSSPRVTIDRVLVPDKKSTSTSIIPSESTESISAISINSEKKEDESLVVHPEASSEPENVDAQPEDKKTDSEVLTENAAKPNDKTEEEGPGKKGFSRFNLTALISPDFSTTSLSKYSKPSGLFGVLIGYKISQRFTVLLGATKSLKKYEGYGNDYSPPKGYWQARTNGVVPDEVEGQCGIIEIPLMIQYDVLQRSKSRLFVSGGVSSYFMRSEHYQYTFNEPNPGAANSWTAKEPTDYLFKIGHLSAGYDRLIGRKFTVGIEPFLKVPFEGIGWTNINLYSTGAYINLRYNILNIQ